MISIIQPKYTTICYNFSSPVLLRWRDTLFLILFLHNLSHTTQLFIFIFLTFLYTERVTLGEWGNAYKWGVNLTHTHTHTQHTGILVFSSGQVLENTNSKCTEGRIACKAGTSSCSKPVDLLKRRGVLVWIKVYSRYRVVGKLQDTGSGKLSRVFNTRHFVK